MKILFCILPPNTIEMPLLGVASLLGLMKRRGDLVTLLDLNLELYQNHQDEAYRWDSRGWSSWNDPPEEWLKEVANQIFLKIDKNDLILLSCNAHGKVFLRKFMELARVSKNEIPILAGGPAFFDTDDIESFNGHDIIICKGEGELALQNWLENAELLLNTGSLNKTPLISAPPCEMDQLPFPDFTFFPDGYKRNGVLPIESSRGCVNRCAFCDDWRMWKSFRKKNAERLERELRNITNLASHLSFTDSILNSSSTQIDGLLRAFKPFEGVFTWEGMMSCRNISASMARNLATSGCVDVFLGIENFNEKFLHKLNKQKISNDSIEAISILHDAGIRVSIGYIVGGPPFQSDGDFWKDLAKLEKLAPLLNFVAINPLCIPRNTQLWLGSAAMGVKFLNAGNSSSWFFNSPKDIEDRLHRCRIVQEELNELGVRTSQFVVSKVRNHF